MSESERNRRLFLTARRTLVVVVRTGNEARVRIYKRPQLRSHYKRVRNYPAVLGKLGYETPRGVFAVTRKTDKPDWLMPHSDWVAEADRGKIIPFDDPRNPIKGAFISIDSDEVGGVEDGVGFHGSADLRLGGGSHGCIRMNPKDAVEMYKLVPSGTPVVLS